MKTQTKVIIFFTGSFLLMGLWNIAYADDKKVPRGASVNVNSQSLGLAASGHQFYWGQKKLQGSVSAATHGNSKALSFALGKRVGKVLVSGSVTHSEDDTAAVAGASWTF